MLKAVLYLGLTALGVIGALFSPLIGAIAAVDAYLLNPTAIPMPDGGFRYQFWTTVAFLAGLLIKRPRRLEPIGREGVVLWMLWGFVAMCAASAAWASVAPEEALAASYEMLKTMVVVTALLWAIRSESDAAWLVTALTVGVVHAAVLHTFGARLGFIPASMDRDEGVLIEGQSPVMVLFVPLLVLLTLRGSGIIQRLLAFCGLPFALNSIVKSYQRTAFVALLAECVLLLLFLPRRITLRLVPLMALAGILFVYRLTPVNYWDRMKTIESPTTEGSAASRFVLADTSWRMFLDYPLGVGYKNYQYVSPRYLDAGSLTEGKRSSHNSFFAVLCDLGIVGFTLWGLAIGITLVTLRKVRKNFDWSASKPVEVAAMGLEIGLYGWLVTGLFGDQSGLDPAYWFMALAVVFCRLSSRKTAEPASLAAPEVC
jgi:hypothetical protein